jgi:CheY-like chemotaxis protein
LQRVFDPVVEPEARDYSHGLDLSKLPGILQQIGGHIQAESEPGAGAAFKIYLPHCDDLSPRADSAHNPLAIPAGHETILLAEDEDSVRSLIRILLQSSGYKVLEAVSGNEAIHIAETYTGQIDLLITDVVLPRMNGKLVVNRVLALRPALKVLLISGYSPDRLARLDCNPADCAFLQKPFRCEVLGNLVRQLLDAPEKLARIA